MRTAQQLFDAAFDYPRDPRSLQYKLGLLAAIEYRLGESTSCKCPFRAGTVDADAWTAGTVEGHRRGRDELEARANPGLRQGAFPPVDMKNA